VGIVAVVVSLAAAALCSFLLYCLRQQGARIATLSGTVSAVGHSVSRQAATLEALGQTVAGIVVPADARVTAAPVAAIAHSAGAPSPRAPAPARPRRDVARELEVALLPEPAVDDTGDRGGINPGDPVPIVLPALSPVADAAPDTTQRELERAELRRSAEAAEDARDQDRARRQLPTLLQALSMARQAPTQADVDPDARRTLAEAPRLGDEDSDDELTVVTTLAPITSARPTLSGIAPAGSRRRHILPEERAAARQAWAEETQTSAGVVRSSPTPPPAQGDAVEQRYAAHCAIARAAGLAVDHCAGADCTTTADGRLCTCDCEGCARAARLLAQARRELLGPLPANDGAPDAAPANDRRPGAS
jgi:hypothetical protein